MHAVVVVVAVGVVQEGSDAGGGEAGQWRDEGDDEEGGRIQFLNRSDYVRRKGHRAVTSARHFTDEE